jgi:hypothetical protein
MGDELAAEARAREVMHIHVPTIHHGTGTLKNSFRPVCCFAVRHTLGSRHVYLSVAASRGEMLQWPDDCERDCEGPAEP